MLPYFPLPSDSKIPEDELAEIVLQLIPVGWKRMMMFANFKSLEHSNEELVECLEGVEGLDNKNPPKRSNQNNNSSGLKKTKKSKHKRDEDEKSHNVTDNGASNKKSCKPYKFCKMFGGSAELHTTDRCNKKNLLSVLLDGHKKKRINRAKKEEFCDMAKAFKKASFKSKKARKRLYHSSLESDSSLEEE
eukprot:8534121-Ditylum_brightwellii.AAC.1